MTDIFKQPPAALFDSLRIPVDMLYFTQIPHVAAKIVRYLKVALAYYPRFSLIQQIHAMADPAPKRILNRDHGQVGLALQKAVEYLLQRCAGKI
jgi:hypothetical protein